MPECRIEGCVRPVFILKDRLCAKHYYRKWRHGSPHTLLHRPPIPDDERGQCAEPGCSELEVSRGMCHRCYMRWYHRGGLSALRAKPPVKRARGIVAAHRKRVANGEVWA